MNLELPPGPYDVILADPPWSYKSRWGDMEKHGAATSHYSTMTLEDIMAMPVADLAAKNCALFLWSVNPKPQEALGVIKAWGFRHRTKGFCWVKTYANGKPYCGLGMYTRSGNEDCLLAIKGSMPPASRSVRQVITAPVRKHSQKPDEIYERIEALYPNARKLELFARSSRPGWDSWGDEAPTYEIEEMDT